MQMEGLVYWARWAALIFVVSLIPWAAYHPDQEKVPAQRVENSRQEAELPVDALVQNEE